MIVFGGQSLNFVWTPVECMSNIHINVHKLLRKLTDSLAVKCSATFTSYVLTLSVRLNGAGHVENWGLEPIFFSFWYCGRVKSTYGKLSQTPGTCLVAGHTVVNGPYPSYPTWISRRGSSADWGLCQGCSREPVVIVKECIYRVYSLCLLIRSIHVHAYIWALEDRSGMHRESKGERTGE